MDQHVVQRNLAAGVNGCTTLVRQLDGVAVYRGSHLGNLQQPGSRTM